MTTKSTNEKLNLETLTISELQSLMDQISNLISDRQSKIRESAQAEIMRLSRESGLRVLVRAPKTKDSSNLGKTFQHPENKELQWVAKQGPKPKWLSEFLKNGRKLEEFEIKAETEAVTATA
jgi:hypothetical protein